jgi:hypothetical protein
MTETFMTSSLLTPETLDWFENARPRVEAYGLINVFEDRADRKLFRAIKEMLAAEKVSTKKKGVGGKKPVEGKLHYRWVKFEAQLLAEMVDTLPGEVSAFAIIKFEQLRALDKYQPKLDSIDTARRRDFNAVVGLLLEDAAELGRVADLDRVACCEANKVEFPDDWNPSFFPEFVNNPFPLGAVIPEIEVDAYRAKVRAEIDTLTREVYPSVVAV